MNVKNSALLVICTNVTNDHTCMFKNLYDTTDLKFYRVQDLATIDTLSKNMSRFQWIFCNNKFSAEQVYPEQTFCKPYLIMTIIMRWMQMQFFLSCIRYSKWPVLIHRKSVLIIIIFMKRFKMILRHSKLLFQSLLQQTIKLFSHFSYISMRLMPRIIFIYL